MQRILVFTYGVACYGLFLFTFLYGFGFVGNLLVPRAMDTLPATGWKLALPVNVTLLSIFALQHSIMARPGFKRWWTRIVPEPMERSTYVLFSSLALILLFWQWRPMGLVIWNVEGTPGRIALHGLFVCGWLTVLVTTFLISHFDLFGLRQVWLYLRGQPYTFLPFRTPGLYRLVRHPLYVGWLLAFWATPTMTLAHLIFALGTTAYILVAIQLEERDLVDHFGERYIAYMEQTPMLLPVSLTRAGATAPANNRPLLSDARGS